MESTNQIGFYQLENLVLQRVNFTLMDLTIQYDVLESFNHLNSYYLSFLKALIQKSTIQDYKTNEVFKDLPKESPVVFVCDSGADSKLIANKLETDKYLNVFYLNGGVAGLKSRL